jgi:cytochrome c oxidase subunit IV
MIFGFVILLTALTLSIVAAFYSVTGLVAIFAAMPVPIIIMGGALEIAKVVTTIFLHNNWARLGLLYKTYLVPAVLVLMFITSLGIFGLLSKAHTDQGLVSGDVGAKIAIFDDQIRTERENIDANRRQLTQMDSAVDQVMSRSTTEGGADKANAIRRSQLKDRQRIGQEITASQKKIASLNEQAAPVRAEVRKVEADVGPIKYIAALVYGDNPDTNLLEAAVRWVIILIVIVFDPLALMLILSANKQFEWARRGKGGWIHDEESTTDEITEQNKITAWFDHARKRAIFWDKQTVATEEPSTYVASVDDLEPVVDATTQVPDEYDQLVDAEVLQEEHPFRGQGLPPTTPLTAAYIHHVEGPTASSDADLDGITLAEKEAQRAWKEANPEETIKKHRSMHDAGYINDLPWMHPDYYLGLVADNHTPQSGEVKGFGTQFPVQASKGDMFLRVDRLPSTLYKFNGINWIEVDKALSDQHAYDDAYIDHLIAKISTGEYDLDLLSEAERASIEQRLNTK